MTNRTLTAIALCILVQAASAECVATTVQAGQAAPAQLQGASDTTALAGAENTGTPQPKPNRELISTATASTRDGMPPAARDSANARRAEEQDHPRRGGTAMLLAALALMSGIALRRYGAPRA